MRDRITVAAKKNISNAVDVLYEDEDDDDDDDDNDDNKDVDVGDIYYVRDANNGVGVGSNYYVSNANNGVDVGSNYYVSNDDKKCQKIKVAELVADSIGDRTTTTTTMTTMVERRREKVTFYLNKTGYTALASRTLRQGQ